jgi:hypothetical protein
MARVDIPYLVTKRNGNGALRHYWQPSAALRRAGYKPQRLADDPLQAAIAAQAINDALARARVDATTTAAAATFGAPAATPRRMATLDALIAAYQASSSWSHTRNGAPRPASTQRWYATKLRVLSRWAGDTPLDAIGRADVATLFEALARPRTAGGPRALAEAGSVLRVGRLLFEWACARDWISANPFAKPGTPQAAARQALWSPEAIDAVLAAAYRLDRPSVALAVQLALWLLQREGDLLSFTWSQMTETVVRARDGHEQVQWRIRLRQSKTGAWVDTRLPAELEAELLALRPRTAAERLARPHILVNEASGQRYTGDAFRRLFLDCRQAAVAGHAGGPVRPGGPSWPAHPPCPAVADLWFADLRRTGIVRLAEAGVDLPGITALSGHQIERTRQILEVYLPRTSAMADAAITQMEAHRRAQTAAQTVLETRARLTSNDTSV